MRSLPWHRSVAPILCNNGLATLAESLDKRSHEAPVARTVNMLFQNFRFDDFDMHHQGLAPSKCHACRKRFCNGPWWSVHARGRPIKTPCMEFHQNRCFPKVPAYPRFDSLIERYHFVVFHRVCCKRRGNSISPAPLEWIIGGSSPTWSDWVNDHLP